MPSPIRIVLKALILFVAFNVVWLLTQPMDALNRLTIHNLLVPGRDRLPFAEFPEQSFSLSLDSLDQMVASHAIARPKASDEYRVALIGDSAVWGYLLEPDQTQAACLNRLNLRTASGKRVVFYNLGHPTLTVMKDWLILRRALRHQPDLILWQTTLASLYPIDQLGFPVIRAQRDEVLSLAAQYGLNLPRLTDDLPAPSLYDRSFFGQRGQVASWLQYQLYGIGWVGTRRDHVVAKMVAPNPVNLNPDENIKSVNVVNLSEQGKFTAADLSLDIVSAAIGEAQTQQIPVILINEPTYRKDGDPLRYNSFYPRWALDTYREAMQRAASEKGWTYADLWDAVPADQFTDTDFHLTKAATCAYAERLRDVILNAGYIAP